MTTETRKESGPSLIFVIGMVSVFAFMMWATLLRKVPMVGQSDPQIVRLKQFAATNHLHWKANITEEGTDYCVSLSTEEPSRYVVGCRQYLASAVSVAIERWESDYGQKVIGEGD